MSDYVQTILIDGVIPEVSSTGEYREILTEIGKHLFENDEEPLEGSKVVNFLRYINEAAYKDLEFVSLFTTVYHHNREERQRHNFMEQMKNMLKYQTCEYVKAEPVLAHKNPSVPKRRDRWTKPWLRR